MSKGQTTVRFLGRWAGAACAALLALVLPAAAAADLGELEVLVGPRATTPQPATPPLPPPALYPIQLVLDDDQAEGNLGISDGSGARQFLWFNRFSPLSSSFDLQEVWVLFPAQANVAPGDAIQLAIYLDPNGDPTDGADLLATFAETVQAADGDTFSVYALPAPVSIRDPGDVLVGVVPRFIAPGDPSTLPAAIDQTASQQRSWLAVWTGDPPADPELPPDLQIVLLDDLVPSAAGNWMIRAFGTEPPVVEIPALGGFGLAALALLLATAGWAAVRRRRGAGLALLLALAFAAAWPALPASAQVVIDEFSDGQGPDSVPGVGSSTVLGGMLGGERDLALLRTAGAGTVTAGVSAGELSFTVPAATTGELTLVWDGTDGAATVLDPIGLSSLPVDLTDNDTQGGLRLVVEEAVAGTYLLVTVYEDADHVSRAGRVLPAISTQTSIHLNFGEFVAAPDALGPADFHDVGAIVLRVGGRNAAPPPTARISLFETAPPQVAAVKVDRTPAGDPIPGSVAPGDTIRYRITISNPGGEAAAVELADVIDANLNLVGGSLRSTKLARRDQARTVTNIVLNQAAPGVLSNDSDPDGNPLAAVPAAGLATAQGGTVNLAADGSFSYTPPLDFTGVDSFPYTLAATAGDPTVDAGGGGIGPATATVYVTIDRVPPVIVAGGTLAYTEDDPPTAIDPALTVTDLDSPNLAGATAQITANYVNGQDVLSFVSTPNITGVFTPASGLMTLSGSDTVAAYQAALRAVRYENTSDAPSTSPRTVTWTATDGDQTSLPATSTITVASVNDPPVLTAGATLNYTEDDPPTPIDTTITVADVDSANLASATAQITANYVNGQDVLSFVNTPNITGVFTPATGLLTLTGADTLANYQTALRSVRYENTSDDPSTLARTVTWIGHDGTDPSLPVTSTINVTAQADAPVLTAGGTLPYTENDPPTAIDTTITVTDVDSANLASATAQITANYANGQDVLSFVNTPNITGVFTPATGLLTLTGVDTLAAYQTALRSVRYNNTSENPSTLPRTVTWIGNDGALTSSPVTSTVTVAAVNDAPVLTAGGTLNYTENDAATAIDTTITVTDVDSANLTGATAQITANYVNGQDVLSFVNTPNITGVFTPATGLMTLSGSDTLANYQTALRSVRYHNTSENPSALARTVTWIGSDGALPSAAVTSTINVIPVNDPPVALDDAFATIGNTELRVDTASPSTTPHVLETTTGGTGVMENDSDPAEGNAVTVSGIALPAACPDTTAPFVCPTTNGGQVTLFADGSFFFLPAPGDAAASDSFTYTLTDDGVPAASDTATVTISRSERVWYVDNSGPAGNGTSTSPFNTIVAANLADDGGDGDLTDDLDVANDYIFVRFGTGTSTGQATGIRLEAGQRLLGEFAGLSIPVDLNGNGSPTVLVPVPALDDCSGGPCRPLIDNPAVGGSAVFATDAIPVEIRGLSLSGNTNGIDLTATGAFAGSGSTRVSDNVIRSAGVEGIDLNKGGTGSLALALHDNTVTATGNGVDVARTAGTLTITAFDDNVVTAATGGSGIVVSGPATFDSDTGNAVFDLVSGGTTVVGQSGDGVGASGVVLANVSGNLEYTDLDVFASNGAGLSVTGTGVLTTTTGTRVAVPGAGVGTLDATGGPAVSINNASTTLPLGFLRSTNSTTTGLSLVSAFGGVGSTALSVTSGQISDPVGASGAAVNISGGTGNITLGIPITNNSGNAVAITGRTGDTVAFTGAIAETGSGLSMTSNGGATISYRGGLTATTGANAAFTATGGGLVEVCDENPCNAGATGGLVNTLTTTTGTALNVASTTITANRLEFRAVASNGAASGIVLNTTGSLGGLSVKGTGSAGSGGTIQSSTASGISLTTTSSVSLASMNVTTSADDGIFGSAVNGITLNGVSVTNNGNSTADEGIDLLNPSGAMTLTGVTATGNAHNNMSVFDSNNAGGDSSLSVTSSTFSQNGNTNGNHGMLVDINGTATLTTSTIASSTFSNNKVIGLQVISGDSATISDFTVSGSTFSDTGTGNSQEISMDFAKAGTSNMTVKVLNNTGITGHNSHGMNFFTAAGAGTTGVYNARISGNTIGNAAVAGSGSLIGNCMRININGDADATVLVDNNVLRQCPNGRGIEVIGRNGIGGADVTITNNDVNTNDVSGFPLAAIFVQSNAVTIGNTVRADVRSNTVPAGTAFDLLPTFIALVETSTSTLELVDTPPASANCTAQLTSTNTGSASASAGCALIAGPISTPPL